MNYHELFMNSDDARNIRVISEIRGERIIRGEIHGQFTIIRDWESSIIFVTNYHELSMNSDNARSIRVISEIRGEIHGEIHGQFTIIRD